MAALNPARSAMQGVEVATASGITPARVGGAHAPAVSVEAQEQQGTIDSPPHRHIIETSLEIAGRAAALPPDLVFAEPVPDAGVVAKFGVAWCAELTLPGRPKRCERRKESCRRRSRHPKAPPLDDDFAVALVDDPVPPLFNLPVTPDGQAEIGAHPRAYDADRADAEDDLLRRWPTVAASVGRRDAQESSDSKRSGEHLHAARLARRSAPV